MGTRRATEAEKAAYFAMKNTSKNWKAVKNGADLFYANGADWRGLDEEFKTWHAACQRWDAEVAAAGFQVGSTGIRKNK